MDAVVPYHLEVLVRYEFDEFIHSFQSGDCGLYSLSVPRIQLLGPFVRMLLAAACVHAALAGKRYRHDLAAAGAFVREEAVLRILASQHLLDFSDDGLCQEWTTFLVPLPIAIGQEDALDLGPRQPLALSHGWRAIRSHSFPSDKKAQSLRLSWVTRE